MTSVPRFWIALIIIYTLVFTFGQQHIGAFNSPQYVLAPWSIDKLVDYVKHIWPVVFIAGLSGVARNMRVMRGNLLDVLNAQYVTTARSKGLTEWVVMIKHAVPNALHPILMYQGTVLPYMMAGELEAAMLPEPSMAADPIQRLSPSGAQVPCWWIDQAPPPERRRRFRRRATSAEVDSESSR